MSDDTIKHCGDHMAPVPAILVGRIKRHKANAAHFRRLAKKRHRRAAYCARRAMALKRKGFNKRAAVALRKALYLKAMAGRAMVRAQFNLRRSTALRKIRLRRIQMLRARLRPGLRIRAARRRRPK
jgi:hypothetical protein